MVDASSDIVATVPVVRHITFRGSQVVEGAAAHEALYIGAVDVAVLIPVKRFRSAKGRLRGSMSNEHRAEFAEWMASRVIAAVAELPTFIACDDGGVRDWANERGAEVVWGPDLGLNRAVDDGVEHLVRLGARQIIVCHADLPRPDGLARIASPGVRTFVPDRRRDGTNVMSFPATARIRAAYGGGSFRRHLGQALDDACVPIEVCGDRDLSLDVDTVDDLHHPLIREVLPPWLPTSLDNHPS